MARFCAPRSMAQTKFQTSLVFRPLSGGGGGGGPESGAHLSNDPDEHARINGDEDHSGPPRLSTFKPRGGGSGIVGAVSNDHDQGSQINGSDIALTFSAALSLTRMGPPPTLSSFCFPFPCRHVSPFTSLSHF
jgi:hypothetical protein